MTLCTTVTMKTNSFDSYDDDDDGQEDWLSPPPPPRPPSPPPSKTYILVVGGRNVDDGDIVRLPFLFSKPWLYKSRPLRATYDDDHIDDDDDDV